MESNPQTDLPEDLMKMPELSRKYNISLDAMRRYVRDKKVKTYKLKGSYSPFLSVSELTDYIINQSLQRHERKIQKGLL